MSQAIPYVMHDNYISVIVDGKPYQLLESHPTFKAMGKAIRKKQWDKVPNLVTVAQAISNRSHGNVEVKGGEVFYKGSRVDSSLTQKMVALIEHSKPVAHMLRFMDNLFKNPDQKTIQELYDFMHLHHLPITDDGCFVAYKRVNQDYTDCYTGTVDNHVGQVVAMPRREVDRSPSVACSQGYHCCSRAYLGGFHSKEGHLMVIKVNPADVVSVPDSREGKVRAWRYEVIQEIPNQDYREQDAKYFQTPLIPITRDRRALIAKLLLLPSVKRLVARTERAAKKAKRRKKSSAHPPVQVAGLTRKALGKAALGRLQLWYERFAKAQPVPPQDSPLFGNPMLPFRVAAKLSVVQVADAMGVKASDVYRVEKDKQPSQAFVDNYLGAIRRIKGGAGVTHPALAAKA